MWFPWRARAPNRGRKSAEATAQTSRDHAQNDVQTVPKAFLPIARCAFAIPNLLQDHPAHELKLVSRKKVPPNWVGPSTGMTAQAFDQAAFFCIPTAATPQKIIEARRNRGSPIFRSLADEPHLAQA
jgi:hypothetical protein